MSRQAATSPRANACPGANAPATMKLRPTATSSAIRHGLIPATWSSARAASKANTAAVPEPTAYAHKGLCRRRSVLRALECRDIVAVAIPNSTPCQARVSTRPDPGTAASKPDQTDMSDPRTLCAFCSPHTAAT
jgi:hypothetical protein